LPASTNCGVKQVMATTIKSKNATIIINLDSTERIKKNLEKIDIQMKQGSQAIVRKGILENWAKAKGGDGKSMPALSTEYKELKTSGKVRVYPKGKSKGGKRAKKGEAEGMLRGGSGKRDLMLSGDIQRAFNLFKTKKQQYKLYFADDLQNAKADGNHNKSGKHMMKVSAKIKKKFVNFINEALFKGAKP